MKSLHYTKVLIGFLIAASGLEAATITSAGTQFIGFSRNPANFGFAWRDPGIVKSYDVDGDNILGSEAYFLAKTNYGAKPEEVYAPANFDTSIMTFQEAEWLFVTASSDPVNSQFNYDYIEFQNPVSPEKNMKVGYMGRRFSSKMIPGNFYSLYNFSVESKVPGKFAITVAMQSQIHDGLPTALKLTQIVGSGSGSKEIEINSNAYEIYQNAAFTTFIITGAKAGDVFQLQGRAQSVDSLVINGIMIDASLN
jgi:hypothetical protein